LLAPGVIAVAQAAQGTTLASKTAGNLANVG